MMTARILIADDEGNILKVLREVFARSGFNVDTAADGEEALLKARNRHYDAALLDMRMPGQNGLHVLEELKRQNKEVVVILMTAYGSINNAVEAMKMGAYDYLTKPFDNNEMVKLVQQSLKARTLLAEMTETGPEEDKIIGGSTAMARVNTLISRIKDLDSTVLITGESGTGKSLIARVLHKSSRRWQQPFVHINCASIPANLMESELFGYERGAFTGAHTAKQGKFEMGGKGTVFLDEIGSLAPELQAKLLTVLEERRVERLGGIRPIEIKARIVAATNTDLEGAVKRYQFREDLFYRLNVISIHVPPLREHREDIPGLAAYFLNYYCRKFNREKVSFSAEVGEAFQNYDWRGNVRELENTIESAVALAEENAISLDCLPARIKAAAYTGRSLDFPGQGLIGAAAQKEQEKQAILEALKRNLGHRGKTAQELGVSRRTLQYRLKEFEIIS